MKNALQRLAALALALVLLAGCAGQRAPAQETQTQPSAPAPAAQPVPIRSPEPDTFGLAYEPDAGFNPYRCMSLCNRTVVSLLFEPLFTVDAAFSAAPYLCRSYTSSGDGRTHTLALREEAAFSDGSPLTAADVTASITAAQGSPYYGRRLRHITGVSAVDDHTVVITTDAACGSLDALLSVYVVKAGTAADESPVGTGPYRLEQGALRRTDWWRNATPAVHAEEVTLTAVADASDVRDAFEYGQITLACADPNAGSRIAYHADFELWNANTTVMQYVGFNLNSTLFSQSAVRTAVTYAIDREAIVSETAGGFAAAAVLPASPYASFYDQRLADSYDTNPAAFAEALAGADLPAGGEEDGAGGVMLVCSASEQRVAAAQKIVDALQAGGLRLTLRALESDAYRRALEDGEFDLYYGEVRLSPDFDLSGFFKAGGELCFGSIADSDAAQLCAMAMENVGNLYDLHDQLLLRGLLCPVLFKTYAVYTARGRVTDLTPCLDGVFLRPMA